MYEISNFAAHVKVDIDFLRSTRRVNFDNFTQKDA